MKYIDTYNHTHVCTYNLYNCKEMIEAVHDASQRLARRDTGGGGSGGWLLQTGTIISTRDFTMIPIYGISQ